MIVNIEQSKFGHADTAGGYEEFKNSWIMVQEDIQRIFLPYFSLSFRLLSLMHYFVALSRKIFYISVIENGSSVFNTTTHIMLNNTGNINEKPVKQQTSKVCNDKSST